MLRTIAAMFFLVGATVVSHAQSLISLEAFGDLTTTNASALVSGDFNNDGKPDLVECCNTGGQMVTRFGNGDGTFQAPVTASSTPVAYYSAAVADVNGDGKLDLLAAGTLNPPPPPAPGIATLLIWLGNGDGTFQNPQSYTTTQIALTIMAGNFFGASQSDVAVAETNNTIDLFQNQGNGNYVFRKTISVVSGSQSRMTAVVAGDLNGTGVTDLAVMDAESLDGTAPQELSILWNDGKGNFTRQDYGGDYQSPVMATARMNGDAQMTLLVSHACSGDFYCIDVDGYYGQGNNTVYKRAVLHATRGVGGANLATLLGVDVDGDGIGDIVAFGVMLGSGSSLATPTGAAVYHGNPDGSFGEAPWIYVTGNEGNMGAVVAADFNRDGKIDFAQGSVSGTSEYYINASIPPSSCSGYTISPTVTVCQPVDNTYLLPSVRVQATSYDTNAPVTQMQQYIDGTLKYSQAASTFDQSFTLTPGPHLLVTKAWDAAGTSFVAERNINVYNGTPGPTCASGPYQANLCVLANMTSDEPIVIVGNGSTVNRVPTAAQLYIDNQLVVNNTAHCTSSSDAELCYGGSSALITSQRLTSGSHLLVFKVWDTAGDVFDASQTITVN